MFEGQARVLLSSVEAKLESVDFDSAVVLTQITTVEVRLMFEVKKLRKDLLIAEVQRMVTIQAEVH